MTIFGVYKRYPFTVPARVKFFNLFRLVFRIKFFEKMLIRRVTNQRATFWKKLIPPLYFYPEGTFRKVKRNGIHFRLDISKQLDHSIYFCTVRDVAWQNLFQIVRPNFSIIDAGANIGYLTLNLARLSPKGVVYSFEPDSETFSKLAKNVSLNDFKNIRLFRTALGTRAGKGDLYRMYESNPGANRILPVKPRLAVRSETVEITSLDNLDSRECFREIDLIKVDVEGYELFVLEGTCNLIRRYKPILFVELVDQNLKVQGCSSASVLQYLGQFDYLILDARTMKPLTDSDSYYTDIICFPGGKSPGYD